MTLTAAIVDDEAAARDGIRLRLHEEPDVTVVGEAADGITAVKVIKRVRPDLVFLDIQLPDFSGLEVLRRVSGDYLPAIIFVTAHDEYAVKAFETRALDYLLKPFTKKRFQEALDRVRFDRAKEDAWQQNHQKLTTLVGQEANHQGGEWPRAIGKYVDKLAVRDNDRFLVVKVDTIDWIESAANYAVFHVGDQRFVLRSTLTELEQTLDPQRFVRVHRATIVNVDRVVEVSLSQTGDHTMCLTDGTTLRLSRTYRDRLFALIPQP